MAVRWQDAIAAGRALIGTPYSELDCINFIKKVIRTAPGGVPTYTTAGTNTLWRSFRSASKYRDLLKQQDSIENPLAGMIAFKVDGEDYHHAGIVTDVGTVLHSSSTQGGRGVVETPLDRSWHALAIHRYITVQETEEDTTMYKARVDLNSENSSLNLRNGPSTKDRVIGSIPHWALVDVLAEGEQWTYVRYNGMSGYVSTPYLERENTDAKPVEAPVEPVEKIEPFTTLVNTDGISIRLAGSWRVAED